MELEKAAAAKTVTPAVIDSDLTTVDMESDADASDGGGGGGNNKKARVAVSAFCCMNCGASRTSFFWRLGSRGELFCYAFGGYILLLNFLMSFFSRLLCFRFVLFFVLLVVLLEGSCLVSPGGFNRPEPFFSFSWDCFF